MANTRRKNRSLQREVIQVLATGPAGISEIAGTLSLTQSETRRVISTLQSKGNVAPTEGGFLLQDPDLKVTAGRPKGSFSRNRVQEHLSKIWKEHLEVSHSSPAPAIPQNTPSLYSKIKTGLTSLFKPRG